MNTSRQASAERKPEKAESIQASAQGTELKKISV